MSNTDDSMVEIFYDQLVHTTNAAILFEIEPGNEVWIPLTMIFDHDKEAKVFETTEKFAIIKDLV